MDQVLKQAEKTIQTYNLIEKGDKVLCALSGGADSVCLLLVLCGLKEKLGFTLCAAHLNHMLRGGAADRDEAFCASLCQSLGVPFESRRVDVAHLAKTEKLTLEEAGRKARYGFLESLGADKIAVAHNQNDVAETLLMRLARGTGVKGLGAIALRRQAIIRPLLFTTRAEIEAFLKKKNQNFCTDETNADNRYTRNKIRNVLLPQFLEMNPNFLDAAQNLAMYAAEDNAFLEAQAKAFLRENQNADGSLCAEKLGVLAPPVLKRALTAWAGEMDAGTLSALIALLKKQAGSGVTLPDGRRVQKVYNRLTISPKKCVTISYAYEIAEAGAYFIPEAGVNLLVSYAYKKGKNTASFDAKNLAFPFVVRSRRPGDKIALANLNGEKKLQNLFVDLKISPQNRNRVPVVCYGDEILWAAPYRKSKNHGVTEKTEKIISFEIVNITEKREY